MTQKGLGSLVAEKLPNDPAVKLPADVQDTIARGETAYNEQSRCRGTRIPDGGDLIPTIITSAVDQSIQDRRDTNLDVQEQSKAGNRRQPPMINRLRAVMIVVDRLMSDGVPFGVGPNSRMNKAVRKWLNDKAQRSPDTRESRRKEITPTAVRSLLKQVKAEGQASPRSRPRPKQTTQDIARELLKKLRASRISSID